LTNEGQPPSGGHQQHRSRRIRRALWSVVAPILTNPYAENPFEGLPGTETQTPISEDQPSQTDSVPAGTLAPGHVEAPEAPPQTTEPSAEPPPADREPSPQVPLPTYIPRSSRYRVADPAGQSYLQAIDRIYVADRPSKVLTIIDEIRQSQTPDTSGPPTQRFWVLLIDKLEQQARDLSDDMEPLRQTIDQALAPLDQRAQGHLEPPAPAASPSITVTDTKRPEPPPSPSLPAAPTPARPSRLTAIGPSGVEGIPAPYDDGAEWFRKGLRRHPKGTWVGLITGWTGIWIALWGAAVGLVLGALVAGGIATGVGSGLGVGQATGVLGIVAGGALGLIAGFLAVLYFLFVARPLQAIFSVIAGAILGIVIVWVAAAFERLGLRIRGYRRLSRQEVRRIAPLVKDAADAMDLPALPRFAMADTLTTNAWTHMRTIVLTTGLLQTLTDQELRAVLVHEFEHWRMGDAVGLHFVWAAAWPVAITYNFGMRFARQKREGIANAIKFAGWVIAWPAWVIIKLIITPVIASSQRRYEYGADAAAKKIGYAADLSSALRKMGAFENGRTGWEQAMAATHPPTELRLEALEPPQPDDYEYQEDELRGPSRREIGRLLRPWRRRRDEPARA
jgi:Zn-dependent protease with chaperone function